MSSRKVQTDLQEKLGSKVVYYLDRKYLLVKFDTLNFAILSKSKLNKASSTSDAILGYYGNLWQALIELIKLKSENNLLDKVVTDGSFCNLQNFVKEYVESTIIITKATITSLEGN